MVWTPGTRVRAALVLVLVAVLGALAGIAGDRLAAQRGAPAAAMDPAGRPGPGRGPVGGPGLREGRGGPWYGQRLGELLDLTSAQRTAIDSILAEERRRVRELSAEVEPRFRAIAVDTRTRIEAVLTDAQRERMRELRQDRLRLLRPESGPGRRGGPGPGPTR